jgi:hypothetical protein
MSAVVGMMIVIVGLSVFVPAVFTNLENPQSTTYDQDLENRVVITGDVNAEITSLTKNQNTINVSVWDVRTGDTNFTGQIGVGQQATVVIDGENITVKNEQVFTDTQALVTYTYPLYVGWPPGAHVIVEESPLFITLGGVMLLAGVILLLLRGEV